MYYSYSNACQYRNYARNLYNNNVYGFKYATMTEANLTKLTQNLFGAILGSSIVSTAVDEYLAAHGNPNSVTNRTVGAILLFLHIFATVGAFLRAFDNAMTSALSKVHCPKQGVIITIDYYNLSINGTKQNP